MVRNIDHLFELDLEFAACPSVMAPDYFSTGVMLISPSAEFFERLQENLAKQEELNGDGFFLNSCVTFWKNNQLARLPCGYNLAVSTSWAMPDYWIWRKSQNRVWVIHFVDKWKPWIKMPSANSLTQDVIDEWQSLNHQK